MNKLTDIHIVDVQESSRRIAYRTPMKFGGRVVEDVVLQDVHVTVETRDGRRGVGVGSMPMGSVWAWPSKQVSGEQALQAMVRLAVDSAKAAANFEAAGHPLELFHQLRPTIDGLAKDATRDLAEPMPTLAALVATSPLDAALHDAYGKAHQRNSYDLLGPDWVEHDLSHYLDAGFAGEYLDRYTRRAPQGAMPLYHLVGALDPLSDADLPERINDGLPETLGEWILADELTHLKIKLNGDDLAWDVQRVAAIESASATAQPAARL